MKKILQLRGMMCSCCEVRVANCLRNVPGVSDAGADFHTNQAWIMCIPETSEADLKEAVRQAGYELISIKDPVFH
ncbi:heavy-metal-associated domain-containing protein [Stecheria sp. CLA-KB-P133]|uniref:Heavy-metal-associated domain-containing protein n=1 Tax=Grylomicrobium aquisgranensis TaxID=2926318 RepID=A0AB35U6C7_9FIRM|nr:heavy-metal-associated domain-containing protein [Stecheria sp. CLA-KB-P133]